MVGFISPLIYLFKKDSLKHDLGKDRGKKSTDFSNNVQTISLIFPIFPATRYPGGRYCPEHQFQCANHICVNQGWVCDGIDDCGDRSDEQLNLCCEKLVINFYVYLDR